MSKKTIIKVVTLLIFLYSFNVSPAYAWKVKTHVYSANLILEDVSDGFVEIEPYGEFEVLPEYAEILRQYPEYYRAGALGPDLLPDIIIGQTIFHPGNTYQTPGDMINTFWHLANELPDYVPSQMQQSMSNYISSTVQIDVIPPKDENDPANDFLRMNNKQQAKAYVLGFMAHAAGDYFGHSYINKWAEKPWPNVVDGINAEEKNIIKRHSVLESYIDSKIPSKYKTRQYNLIKVPQRFLFDTMLVDGELNMHNIALDSRMAQFFGDTECVPPHMELFFAIRDACASRIETINNNKNGNAWDQFVWGISLQAAQKAYCEAWIEDIDRGLGAWIDANERAAQTMVIDGYGMEQYKDELKKWYDEHFLSMLGYPDVAVSVKNDLGSVSDFIMEIVPNSVEQDYKAAKQDAINYAVKKVFNIDLNEWMTLLNPPLSSMQTGGLFRSGSFDTINQEMGNFATCTNTNDQEFAPFKNTLTLTKLTLIGEPGIQELRRVSGSGGSLSFPPFKNTMTYFIRNMDVGYDWNNGSPLMGFFMWGSNEDKNKILNLIFDLNPEGVRPTFSDMTQGPIEIVPGPREYGSVPDIYVKYQNAPNQINATIGLYSTDSFIKNPEQWKNIAGKVNSDFLVTTPGKAGKYHFRIYDNNNVLLAVSNEIEVVAVEKENNNSSQTTTTTPTDANTQPPAVENGALNGNGLDLTYYRSRVNETLNITVTGRLDGSVWGNGIYTDDSDVSTAAVHAGIVKYGETKTVRVTILPGQSSYEGSWRNGVRSEDYIEFDGSFKFTDVSLPLSEQGLTEGIGTTTREEDLYLVEYQGMHGTVINLIVTGDTEGDVWGTDVYTDDSDISAAAVHAGILKVGETKTISITILPGQSSYRETLRNGVESGDYGEWDGSFKFNDVSAAPTPVNDLNEQDDITGVKNKYYAETNDSSIFELAENSFIMLQIDNPNMSVNGEWEEIDPGRGTTPMIISSRSMVPIRAVVEALDGTVSWEGSSQKITLTAQGNTVVMWIDKNEILVNGNRYYIDVAPTIVNGRTYVPLRFAAENLNTKVYWINSTREAVIIY
ncbi:stalk domain-containing protein [Sedimentibacter saalensis]|uniref:stalk domain-containing protein n=1 Tax=Sedimentibacter saalensis TaxID=130788 RepID=UPI0028A11B4F|nr:LCCL domain-containing protein [Sedimentibacter saalensis]